MATNSKIKIILFDKEYILCQGLEQLFQAHGEMKVVGLTDQAEKVLQLNRDLKPDIVIMDTHTSVMDNFELCRQIIKENSGVRIVFLADCLPKYIIQQALQTGIMGFVLKQCSFDELVYVIHTAGSNNKPCMCPRMMSAFADGYVKQLQTGKQATAPVLTKREGELIVLLCHGETNNGIAAHLGLSPKTIDACRRRIMVKLNIDSVAGLVKYALREGLTSLND